MTDAAALQREDTGALDLLACIGDEVTRETVNRVVSHLSFINGTVRAGNLATARKSIDPAAPPHLMLLDIADSGDPAAEIEQIMHLCSRSTRVLVIGSVNDVSLYRALIGLGVVEYLVKPVSGDLLHDAITAIVDQPEAQDAPQRSLRVTALVGARGGIGTTTIATAIGWYFVHEFHQRAALADLDLHFGNLALSLDLEPGRGLREALTSPERIDSLLISSAMTSVSDRLKVLAGEEPLDEECAVNIEALDTLYAALGQEFDQLVIDLPRSLGEGARHIIAGASRFVIVTDLSIAGLRDSLRLIELGKRVGNAADPLIVASQVGAAHRGEINQREFERGLGASISFQIPFDAKAAATMARKGKAMPDAAGGSKAATELLALAQELTGRETVKKSSLLGRLWK